MSGTYRVLARGARLRPLSLLLALLAHGAALWLASWQRADEPDAPPVLVYVQPIALPRPTAARTSPPPPGRMPRQPHTAPPRPAPTLVTEPAAPSTAISVPSPDWQHELQLSARNVVRDQAEPVQRLRSLDSRPKILELPRVSTDPEPGDVTVLSNGDLLVTFAHGWTCTHNRPALDELFSVWAKHRPLECTKKGDGAEDGKIELQRRDYLREPLADPPAGN